MENNRIRKKRCTDYSMTQRLIKTLSIEEVEKAWKQSGMNAWEDLSNRMNEQGRYGRHGARLILPSFNF